MKPARLVPIVIAGLFAAACGSSSADVSSGDAGDAASDAGRDAGAPDAGRSDAGTDAGESDAGLGDAGTSDAGADDAGPLGAPDAGSASLDGGTYRNSLAICWTDAACPRVMAIGHGGLWNLTTNPYDSNGAIAAAYAGDMDGVKIDVRVTSDNVPVISHSSPIQIYESVDCVGQKIEDMTAAQVTQCHRFPSTTETFQRLDDVLEYLRGKMVAQLCVKLSTDYGRTIEQLHTQNAEDFAFIELASTSDLQNIIPTLPGSADVYYLVNVGTTVSDVNTLLTVINNPRAFMYEFDPSVQLGNMVTTLLHPAGIRAFIYDNATAPSESDLEALFVEGADVVSANVGATDVQARSEFNTGRGVSPP